MPDVVRDGIETHRAMPIAVEIRTGIIRKRFVGIVELAPGISLEGSPHRDRAEAVYSAQRKIDALLSAGANVRRAIVADAGALEAEIRALLERRA